MVWESAIEAMLDVLLHNGCSLCARNNKGHTPFSLALEQQETELAQILSEEEAFGCGAWDSPIPILLLIAKSGTEQILDRLLGLGFQPSPADYLCETPLHRLGAQTNFALAARFEQLLPGSRELHSDGKMPWEYYLEATDFDPSSSEILVFLIQPFLLDSQDMQASRIWNHYTKGFSLHASREEYQAADQIFTSLVHTGVMRHYEKVQSQSGLLSLSSVFSVFVENSSTTNFPLADSTVCLLIESTEYWSTFQESPSACQLLKLSASLKYDKALEQLLQRGVEVNRRVGDVSAIEHVCALPAINDESVSRFQSLLKHADPAFLNLTNPNSGLGLIPISDPRDGTHYRREILQITIASGANPNLRTTTHFQSPGMVYHLEERNFDLASVLLERGADLTIRCKDGWSPLRMAAFRNATGFLSKLISPKDSYETLNWEIGCRFSHGSESFAAVKPLHLAATGSTDFLMDLLDRVPSINLEATTDHGLTAVHFAALWGCQDALQILVSRGANINAQSTDGRLALHIAVETGNLSLVERLLELNSDTTPRSNEMTPLLLAYQLNHQAIIDRLKMHTATSPDAASASEKASSAALSKAVAGSIRANNLSACQTLLKEKPSVDIDMCQGNFNCTPLAMAIGLRREPIVKWLLESGANANSKFGYDRSAMQDMITRLSLNPILQAMLDKYLADGGCILSEPNGLVNLAVNAQNNEGLYLLFKHLRTNESCYGSVIPYSVVTCELI